MVFGKGWVFLLAAVVLAINVSRSADAQGQLPGQFPPDKRILSEVTQSALQVRRVLDEIDLTKLPLKYNEGKILEQRRQLSIRWLDRVARRIHLLKATGFLATHLQVLTYLMEVDANVDGLISGLANPITYSQTEGMKTSLKWARKLSDSREALERVLYEVDLAVFEAAVRADELLAVCGGTPR